MLIEKKFKITAKRKIEYGAGFVVPTQEVYKILRETGFYDVSVEEVEEPND